MKWKPKQKIYSEWHRWFAWRPVYGVGSNQWFWLEWVDRKADDLVQSVWYYRDRRQQKIWSPWMTLDAITKQIEDAGFAWALERHPGRDYYEAVVEAEADARYIGDQLEYNAVEGPTAIAALIAAFERAKKSQ